LLLGETLWHGGKNHPEMSLPNPDNFGDHLVFVDESGDHGLARVDPVYPIFVLAYSTGLQIADRWRVPLASRCCVLRSRIGRMKSLQRNSAEVGGRNEGMGIEAVSLKCEGPPALPVAQRRPEISSPT
jgi:hypothetical protein